MFGGVGGWWGCWGVLGTVPLNVRLLVEAQREGQSQEPNPPVRRWNFPGDLYPNQDEERHRAQPVKDKVDAPSARWTRGFVWPPAGEGVGPCASGRGANEGRFQARAWP